MTCELVAARKFPLETPDPVLSMHFRHAVVPIKLFVWYIWFRVSRSRTRIFRLVHDRERHGSQGHGFPNGMRSHCRSHSSHAEFRSNSANEVLAYAGTARPRTDLSDANDHRKRPRLYSPLVRCACPEHELCPLRPAALGDSCLWGLGIPLDPPHPSDALERSETESVADARTHGKLGPLQYRGYCIQFFNCGLSISM
jgi:hypothetical protein